MNNKKISKPKNTLLKQNTLKLLNGSFLSRDKVIAHLPFVFFITLVMILYISYGYYAEKSVKELNSLEVELKDLKAECLTSQSELEQLKQQSNVAQSIQNLGLQESVEPPFHITNNQN